MNKEEVKAELAKLEAEAAQVIANSNILKGAKVAFERVLAAIEAKEHATVADIKTDISEEASKAIEVEKAV